MTQTRPEACICRGKPVWCDPCLQSGFALGAPEAERLGASAMPVPSVHAELKAELIALALENVRLKHEVATLRALVNHLDPKHTNAPRAVPWDLFEPPGRFAHEPDQQHANEPAPSPPGIPASALRQRHQVIGLLSTADAGRVRLGGYAPTLPR